MVFKCTACSLSLSAFTRRSLKLCNPARNMQSFKRSVNNKSHTFPRTYFESKAIVKDKASPVLPCSLESSQLLRFLRHREYIPLRNSPRNVQRGGGGDLRLIGERDCWTIFHAWVCRRWKLKTHTMPWPGLCVCGSGGEMDLSYVFPLCCIWAITASLGPGSPPHLFLWSRRPMYELAAMLTPPPQHTSNVFSLTQAICVR